MAWLNTLLRDSTTSASGIYGWKTHGWSKLWSRVPWNRSISLPVQFRMDKSFPGLKLISPAIGLKLTHRKTNFLPPHWHWFHFSQWQTVAFQWQPHKRHHHPRVLQRVAGKSGKHEQCKLMQNAAFNTFERKLPSFHNPPPPFAMLIYFFRTPETSTSWPGIHSLWVSHTMAL